MSLMSISAIYEKKIDGKHSQKLIKTVRGVGYVLKEE